MGHLSTELALILVHDRGVGQSVLRVEEGPLLFYLRGLVFPCRSSVCLGLGNTLLADFLSWSRAGLRNGWERAAFP